MNLFSLVIGSDDEGSSPQSPTSVIPMGTKSTTNSIESHRRPVSSGTGFFGRRGREEGKEEPLADIKEEVDEGQEACMSSEEGEPFVVESILCECLRDSDSAGDLELLKACSIGRLDVVKRLVGGKKVNVNGFTLLSDHIHQRNCPDDESRGAHGKKKMNPGPGWPPLCAAACKGHAEIVEYLLKHGAQPDIMTIERETRGNVQYFPLYLACGKGFRAIVEILLRYKNMFDINLTQQQGYNVVIGACMMGNQDPELLRMILDHGANVNHLDPKGGSAMFLCAQHGRPDFMDILFQYGASASPRPPVGHNSSKARNSDPIHIATSRNNISAIRVLLAHGADVNAQIASSGATPLILAAYTGHLDAVKLLLENGAYVNVKDAEGQTALHKIFDRMHRLDFYPSILSLLMEHGADIDAKANDGATPLEFAILSGNVEAALLLLELGAKCESHRLLKALLSSLNLMHMSLNSFEKLVKSMINHGLDLNVGLPLERPEEFGNKSIRLGEMSTVLHHALMWTPRDVQCDVIRVFVENGVDVDCLDSNGVSPLLFACGYGFYDCVNLLLELRADSHLTDRLGNNILIACCSSSSTLTVKLDELVDFSLNLCDINDVNFEGDSALAVAIQCKNLSLIEKLCSFTRCDIGALAYSARGKDILSMLSNEEYEGSFENGFIKRSQIYFMAALHPKYGREGKVATHLLEHPLYDSKLVPEILSFMR